MAWTRYLTSAALVAGAFALPNPGVPRVVHEKRERPTNLRLERVEPEAIIPIRIALKQQNLESGYERLMDVSHPTSPNFGKHLSAQEVHDIFAPSDDTLQTVRNWLLDSGVKAEDIMSYTNRGWLAVNLPAAEAEDLFSAEYYEHHSDTNVKIGCEQYSLPAHVAEHVDFIKPGVKLSSPLKKRTLEERWWEPGPGGPGGPSWPGPQHTHPNVTWPFELPPAAQGLPFDLQNCGVNITPACIYALYDLPPPYWRRPQSAENAMGLYESGDAFAVKDIQLFFQHFAPWVPQSAIPKVLSVDGGVSPVAPGSPLNGGESDIDIDLATSIIYPQKVIVYQVDDPYVAAGGENNTGFLNEFLDAVDGSYCNYTAFGITGDSPGIDPTYPDPNGYMGPRQCGVYNLTRVLSVSYGEAEANFPRNYVERQCNEFMKLGLQGHSVFIAAGDYGVASFPGSDNDTFGCLSAPGLEGQVYNPDYPSGCPYLTAVGGTRLYPNQTVLDTESVMQVNLTAFNIETGVGPVTAPLGFFASGGGFSNFFTPPAYQAEAVANYLANYAPDVPSYVANASGTNYGENGGVYNRAGRGYPDVAANGAFLLIYNNLTEETFFGTSLASPIFASVVTLINEERSAIGKGPVGFVNPTLYAHPEVLHDVVNGSNPNCGSSGFSAEPGWDPVSGLGTPDYPRMLELFLSLP